MTSCYTVGEIRLLFLLLGEVFVLWLMKCYVNNRKKELLSTEPTNLNKIITVIRYYLCPFFTYPSFTRFFGLKFGGLRLECYLDPAVFYEVLSIEEVRH